jgi:glycosyltransferase involved in cell wall biosynthesis
MMRVVYVSKAMVVPAYRDKLNVLGRQIELTAVVPLQWGRDRANDSSASTFSLRALPVWFSGHNHFHLYRGITALLSELRPDLVHIDEEPYSAVTTQLVRACVEQRVRTLFFAWQNLEKRLPPPFSAARSFVFNRVAGGIAGTEAAAAVLRHAGFAGPMAIIPQMGVDPDRFTPDLRARAEVRRGLGISESEFVVGFGGRLVREKGVHLLIEAASQVPGAHVLVLGDGPERAQLERQAVLRLGGRAHFPGGITSIDMPRWLNALDVLVLPSLSTRNWVEQFGRILVEAMACGVPVIGARCGEIPQVIGDAGLTFKEGDTNHLAAELSELNALPDRRAAMGQRGRALVAARYTQDQVVANTVRFYREVLA